MQASNLPQGGGARGGRGDPSDDHSWSKTSWRPPQRLCPYHHPQPDQFQYQLLQGDFVFVILNLFIPAFGNTNITMVMAISWKFIQKLLAPNVLLEDL